MLLLEEHLVESSNLELPSSNKLDEHRTSSFALLLLISLPETCFFAAVATGQSRSEVLAFPITKFPD
jgi:hypothetical protein